MTQVSRWKQHERLIIIIKVLHMDRESGKGRGRGGGGEYERSRQEKEARVGWVIRQIQIGVVV